MVEGEEENEVSGGKRTEMGRKPLVPYGLYRAHGFYNPYLAERSGADDEDLALFWQALQHMWALDRSAARGFMACRGIYVFSHDNALGNAPAHKLFARVIAQRRADVAVPRSYEDYQVIVNEDGLPEGVALTRLAV